MARLGTYEYPEVGLSESIALGQKVAREFAGEVSRHGLARSLGMAERGGAFAARVGAVRMWGIATGRGRLRVTRDGLRAVNPLSPQEADAARRVLASQVPLFDEMASRLSSGPFDAARLAVLVEEITGEDRSAVAPRISVIDRVFSEVRTYLLSPVQAPDAVEREAEIAGNLEELGRLDDPGAVSTVGQAGAPTPGQNPRSLDEATERYLTGSSGRTPAAASTGGVEGRIEIVLPDGRLSLPETVSNIDAALTVLWARRQLIAVDDVNKGRPTPPPPREFTKK